MTMWLRTMKNNSDVSILNRQMLMILGSSYLGRAGSDAIELSFLMKMLQLNIPLGTLMLLLFHMVHM